MENQILALLNQSTIPGFKRALINNQTIYLMAGDIVHRLTEIVSENVYHDISVTHKPTETKFTRFRYYKGTVIKYIIVEN